MNPHAPTDALSEARALPRPRVPGALGARIVTAAERPDLVAWVPALLRSRWPAFMLDGRPGHNADLTSLVMNHLSHQVLVVGGADELLGAGLSVPLRWDGTVGGLPAGWDDVVTTGADLHEHGGTANAACAMSITVNPAASGHGLAAGILHALNAAAGRAGVAALIAPVRPILKEHYPLTPMARYVTWRTEDGRVFDPWLRLHLRLDGIMLGVASHSMTITGSVTEWQDWLGLPLPDSGEYIIPGGLVPLLVDRKADTGMYDEPNVWVVHRTQR
jgi:hypothetical protein